MPSVIDPSIFTVQPDPPDLRDCYYTPSLRPLRPFLDPPATLSILHQGDEGACTGFGLAATINILYRSQGEEFRVSSRMLYEMAKRYDEWVGADYEGSSCRGAIKGWKNTGVCLEHLAPYDAGDDSFTVTPEVTEDARKRTVGAYYRLHPTVSDFHAALLECGVVYVSANIHNGWFKPVDTDDGKTIPLRNDSQGGHAFALVGYNRKGFWVQNSWGDDWGQGGLALWLYEDWAVNVMDAWVVQLALPTPQIFDLGLIAGTHSSANQPAESASPPRVAIEEHFVHLDDGSYHNGGRYWSNPEHMTIVQEAIRREKPKHLLLYAHGGLNSIKASAQRIAEMKPVFLANGIYPFHFMYDTGLLEELKDIILRKEDDAKVRSGGFRDWFDRRIENLTEKVGRALWREMKQGAKSPFSRAQSDGSDVLERLSEVVHESDGNIKVHVAGHSTGAILHAHLLTRLEKQSPNLEVATCSLLAPAATISLFEDLYRPLLKRKFIQEMAIYNLNERLELDDTVAKVYGKSLLYLVSRAFEDDTPEAILGMEKYRQQLDLAGLPVTTVISDGQNNKRSRSISHGGFDNDPYTLNDMLKRLLGHKPKRFFT
ncbi:C1 family peptidase [Pseudomaricurvus sp.]|uniref:C1 family peptidase n=1 Tax=Pseudomaricurvus sp. TaxID=2004510 RepID=UPI003F6C2A2F